MAIPRATSGNNSQFTYDFGITIAQSTVNKLVRLTGATLTLASAYYALRTNAEKYVDTLRENSLRFGGILSTMKAMEAAQNRLIKGQSFFSVDDQLRGMNSLMAVGVKVGENFEFINKAAHATGKSYAQFANAISQGIQGNMQALVDMGLMTQRSTRYFEKYRANTIQRQQAVLNFVKQHKGLQELIKNDFLTIQDQMKRLNANMKGFLTGIVGKPNDPNSLYGQTVGALKSVADAFARNYQSIVQYGKGVGIVLGWVVRQIGHIMVWLGRQAKQAVNFIFGTSETFVERMRTLVVVLEFWKLRVVSFFKTYKEEIKTVLKLLIAYQALKSVFVISNAAIASAKAFRAALMAIPLFGGKRGVTLTLGKYLTTFWSRLKLISRIVTQTGFKAALGTLLSIMKITATGKFVGGIGRSLLFVVSILRNLPAIITAVWTALNATNPVGWIILATTAFTVLYAKCEKFRNFINRIFSGIKESIQIVWNSFVWLFTQVRIGWQGLKDGFINYVIDPVSEAVKGLIPNINAMWDAFKNNSVVKWMRENIINPIGKINKFIMPMVKWAAGTLNPAIGAVDFFRNTDFLRNTNRDIADAARDLANKHGFGDYTWGGNSVTPTDSVPTPNPIISGTPPVSQNTTENQSVVLGNGAVQIIVQKGENIDERRLAQEIRRVLSDIQRDNRIRGGV